MRPVAGRCRSGLAPGSLTGAGEGGFSLIEVLVAFTIMTLFLGGLFQVFAGGLRAARSSADHTRAILFAESKLAALGVEDDLLPGLSTGRFDDTYEWRTVIEPYTEEGLDFVAMPVDPVLATVEVLWRTGRREQSVSLTTLKLITRR